MEVHVLIQAYRTTPLSNLSAGRYKGTVSRIRHRRHILPLVPLVLLIPVATGKFAIGVKDTGGKYAAGVSDTSANLPPVSMTPALGA
jgi:hypothetical protein